MVANKSIRWLLCAGLLAASVGPAMARPIGDPLQHRVRDGWSTQAVSRAMSEIQARHGGSMLRQQPSGDTLLVQWKTRAGVQVFVIEPDSGRWYPARRRDARSGR